MSHITWNFYCSGILYGKITEREDGLYVSMLDSRAGKYGKAVLYTEEADSFFRPFSRRTLSDFFQMKEECEAAVKASVEEFTTVSGAVYKKRKDNSYIQRKKKYPFDLFHENGELYAVYMTVRDSMAVLVKEGWEEKTVLKEWKNVFGEKAFLQKAVNGEADCLDICKEGMGQTVPYYRVVFRGTFRVETRDGEFLSTDVYLPDGLEKVPVVLIRTPYNKSDQPEWYFPFVQRGYGVVIQDVRGREESTGEWRSHYYEVEDGDDTLNWIAAQEWSDGNVGMTGGSYLGMVQWAAAASGNPHLKAMLSDVAAGSAFVDFPRRGGCMCSGTLAWDFMMSKKHMDEKLMDQPNWDEILDYRPLQTIPERALGYPVPFISELFDHEHLDDFWYRTSWKDRYAGGPVPALILSGWFDDNGMGTTEALDLVKDWPEGSWKTVLGAWKHSGNADYDIHGLYVGEDALRYDLDVLSMKWLEHFLKGVDNGIEKTASVEYYSLGEMKWKEAGEWPPKSVQREIWYFDGAEDDCGAGNGESCGEGTLTVALLSNGKQKDTYLYDPANPAHHIIDMAENEIEVPEDYTEEEKRKDILSYTSSVLTEPLTVTGDMTVKLYISCDQPDTDFMVRLTDVDKTGRSMKLADGILGAKYRNSFEKPEYLKPGEVYELNIRTTKLSHCFLPGHKIRVTVTSSAKNFIFPNSNTEKGFNSEEIRTANVTVHRNRRYASCIYLPVENGELR
ncbi:MAG: CocE/NonD family hydrolase [Lachnospiraceae bacterium]|nr:CocE/NonD family hydrolase [Lachnospiraceae bacterium]